MASQRKEISDIEKTQADIARGVKRARSSAQAQGRKEQNALWALFEAEQYATRSGAITGLRHNSPGWLATKAKLGLDLRRGHAGLGLSKSIKSPRSFIRTSKGFVFDIKASGLSTKARRRRNKGRKLKGDALRAAKSVDKLNRRVFRYADFYARQKAPGLGNFTAAGRKRIRDVITASFSAALVRTKRIRKNVRQLTLEIRGLG